MLNKDIHNGLEDKEIRDYLAEKIIKLEYFINENYDRTALQLLEKQRELKDLLDIIKRNNWFVINIINIIEDYNKNNYIPFIGSIDEYNKILENIINENKISMELPPITISIHDYNKIINSNK